MLLETRLVYHKGAIIRCFPVSLSGSHISFLPPAAAEEKEQGSLAAECAQQPVNPVLFPGRRRVCAQTYN